MIQPYYQDEAVCIYHGDCREVLPFLPKTDLLLTDPPYGIGEASGKNKSRSVLAVSKDFGVDDWDNAAPPRWLLECAMERARHSIIWGGNYYGLPAASCWLVWDKDNGENDFADCELAWTNIPKAVRRLRYRWAGMLQEPGCRKEVRVHPTQKPEAVMRWALMQAPDGCNVLDPFMGSGTTLVAAKRLGRKAIEAIGRDDSGPGSAAGVPGRSAVHAGRKVPSRRQRRPTPHGPRHRSSGEAGDRGARGMKPCVDCGQSFPAIWYQRTRCVPCRSWRLKLKRIAREERHAIKARQRAAA